MGTFKTLETFVAGHPAAAAVIAAAVLAGTWMAWRAARRLAAGTRNALRGHQAEDLLTVVAAGLAQAVVMNGMWRFAGSVLRFGGAERVSLFAFLEIAVITCAFRARRNMREFAAAGAEGIAVWVLSGLSAVFSALDARSGAEAVFRLAAPLVAAWLWHRAMALEHRRSSGRVVHWRVTLERVLVWLRLAEPAARAASDVDAHRRIARLARAARRLRERQAAGAWSWRQDLARRRLDKALEAAVEHAGLACDPARQDQMRDQIAALNAAGSLARLDLAAPWDRRDAEAAEITRARAEASALAGEAAQAAEARIQAAAGEADRARDLAAKATGQARARVHALEQSLAAERARAETALRAARTGKPRTDKPAPEADRAALVAELAGGIRAAAAAGDRWRPPYKDLMRRTGRQKRYCEYLVADARGAVFGSAPEPAQPAPGPAHAESRAGELALANGHAPAAGPLN